MSALNQRKLDIHLYYPGALHQLENSHVPVAELRSKSKWVPFEADGSLGTVGTTVKLTTVERPRRRFRNNSDASRGDASRRSQVA